MAQSPQDDRSDEALIIAAGEGDVRAFERLLDRHQSRVLRLLRLLGIPPNDREDLAQDIFVRVFRGLERFRPGQGFRSWIYRITVNVSHDYRRTRRRRIRESEWNEALESGPGAGRTTPDLEERLDQRRRLESALAGLSERERAVFVLCELEALDTGEVARALGISAITVRRHLGRARSRLQRGIREKEKRIAAD